MLTISPQPLAPQGSDEAPCVIKGTIPPGGSVPIHSHQAIEVFYVLSGNVEVLSEKYGKTHWIAAGPGDFIRRSSSVESSIVCVSIYFWLITRFIAGPGLYAAVQVNL
jgi:anti-sigma factor ChrR (cupin superfamily)